MHPVLIGIAGPSGAGKSELARALQRSLPAPAALVSLDSYYRSLTHLSFEERCRVNFDDPEMLEWPLILNDVARLARGESILEPVYLFEKHDRAAEWRRIDPQPFVILEGLFALHHASVRARLEARIYVHAPDEVCLERRMARDVVERGRTRESVLHQWNETVYPSALRFVIPTQAHADLIVSGESALEDSVAAVSELLRQAA
jgi:uridine kinase